jgi:AcrR family transcriptional regulator
MRAYRVLVSDMPRRTQRQRVGESSRRLAEAAIALIAEKGYAATTAQEIALRAGYSREMVRVRFGTKEALLDAILTSQYESRLDPPDDPDDSGLDRVLGRIARMRAFAEEDPQLLRAMLVLNFEAAQTDDLLRQRIRHWLDTFLDGITAAIRTGQADATINRTLDAETQAREILSTAIGYAYWWIVEPDRFDLPRELTRWAERVETSLRSSTVPAQRGNVASSSSEHIGRAEAGEHRGDQDCDSTSG